MREAILAAEDKNFFSHSGIDYGAFPRVVWKTLASSASASWSHSIRDERLSPAVVFPQGGSTLTQQLVRGYFLRHLTSQEEGGTLIGERPRCPWWRRRCSASPPPTSSRARWRRSASPSGSSARWSGATARKRRAKEEILARYASFIYMGNGRYGFSAASEYYFAKPLVELRAGRRRQGGPPGRHHQVPARLRAVAGEHGPRHPAPQRHPGA